MQMFCSQVNSDLDLSIVDSTTYDTGNMFVHATVYGTIIILMYRNVNKTYKYVRNSY
jgi:hypothetical protein